MSLRIAFKEGDCTELVDKHHGQSSWPDYQPCGRPALDGSKLCSLHSKVQAKRDAKDKARNDKHKAGEERRKAISALAKDTGLNIQPVYKWRDFTYDPVMVMVPEEELRQLLALRAK